MYASFTSTSTSSVRRSAMVTMAVRVSPPPADEGATISPTSASLRSTVPSNGARTRVFSRFAADELGLGARALQLRGEHVDPRLRGLEVGVGDQVLRPQRLRALQVAARLRELGVDPATSFACAAWTAAS